MAAKKNREIASIPLMALRGLMVFPHMVLHFDVGRAPSIAALEHAMLDDQRVFLVAQRDGEVSEPSEKDLCKVGTVAAVKQVLNLPGDVIRVLVEGVGRGILRDVEQGEHFMTAKVEIVPETEGRITLELKALVRAAHEFFEEYARVSTRVSAETLKSVMDVSRPDQLADIIAANVLTQLEDRQKILEEIDVNARLEQLCSILKRESELAGVERQVQARLRDQIEKNQKDYYLREQIKAIQTELGDTDATDTEDLEERLKKVTMPEEARQKVERELQRLQRMMPGTPEIGVSRTYVEWILEMPWGEYTKESLDLKRARRVLNEDHYGMEKVKERIIEFLAVRRVRLESGEPDAERMKGPILCFVGPPGVGKTSIVRAIAKATRRKFVQMSLGGVRDEAELRGHRRTYVGAIPGRVISGIKQAGSMNPVFLFDEIDKMAHDFRGDPASAMLEVLDSEQNFAFRDHYMDIPFDLSRVLFITTANSVETIPAPLLDRVEIIEVTSYTEEEKLQIAKRHLWPRQLHENGLQKAAVRLQGSALRLTLEGYTREAGVRELNRMLGALARKSAVRLLDTGETALTIREDEVRAFLGPDRFMRDMPEKVPMVGVVNGLAFTQVGGVTLAVECAVMPGSGALSLTGQLGDVMKESAQAALSWVRAHAKQFGLNADFYKTLDIHIHVPEGAVPKDGPSAGVAMVTALVSAVCGVPVRQDVAMTGEITLRGRVLPIGGVKEKLLAAYRAGILNIMLPVENQKDLLELPENVRGEFHITLADTVETVLHGALAKWPGSDGVEKDKSETE